MNVEVKAREVMQRLEVALGVQRNVEATRLIEELIHSVIASERERIASLVENQMDHAGTKEDPCTETDSALELLAIAIRRGAQ